MKTLAYMIIASVFFISCKNQEVEFPDHKFNAVYFPLQYPLRTLVLGDSRSDNSLDKKLQFHIGLSIGGMYENTKAWDVAYKLDESLVPANLAKSTGEPIKILPQEYYTLSPLNKTVIPSGSFSGLILVQLTDAFLGDPLAVSGDYVIPLSIVSSTADSILRGIPAVPNPNKNVPSDWDASAKPKDYVLFGIKYINPYHGNYFHRGKDVTLDTHGNAASTTVYHQKYVEQDQLWKLSTSGRSTVLTNGIGSKFTSSTKLSLDISNDGNIQVGPVQSSAIKGTGTGKYVKDAELWGGVKHHAMYLNYTYKEGAVNHMVTDTLVFRENGVVFEELALTLN
jgi:hypothetical protein